MYIIKKSIRIFIFLILGISFLRCSNSVSYDIPEPALFYSSLKETIEKEYYFDTKIESKDIQRAMERILTTNDINTLNPEEYLLEILDNIYKKDKKNIENYYRTITFEILKDLKGRNIYIPPSTLERFENPENRSGIGLVLFEESEGKFFIMDVVEGSPAYINEIKPNQYLQKIENEDIQNWFLEDVTAKIRGKTNSKVKITVQGKDYEIYRSSFQYIPIRRTDWKINNKNILYFQIRSFNEGTSNLMKQYIFENRSPDLMILDLRYLSSGEINEIFKISDLFISNLKIMKVYLKNQETSEISTSGTVFHTGNIVVLVQEKSSPLAFAIAHILLNNKNVTVIGPKKEREIYISKRVVLQKNKKKYGAFQITNGYIEILKVNEKIPKGKWYDENFDFPITTLETKPNMEDPFHRKIIQLLNSL